MCVWRSDDTNLHHFCLYTIDNEWHMKRRTVREDTILTKNKHKDKQFQEIESSNKEKKESRHNL